MKTNEYIIADEYAPLPKEYAPLPPEHSSLPPEHMGAPREYMPLPPEIGTSAPDKTREGSDKGRKRRRSRVAESVPSMVAAAAITVAAVSIMPSAFPSELPTTTISVQAAEYLDQVFELLPNVDETNIEMLGDIISDGRLRNIVVDELGDWIEQNNPYRQPLYQGVLLEGTTRGLLYFGDGKVGFGGPYSIPIEQLSGFGYYKEFTGTESYKSYNSVGDFHIYEFDENDMKYQHQIWCSSSLFEDDYSHSYSPSLDWEDSEGYYSEFQGNQYFDMEQVCYYSLSHITDENGEELSKSLIRIEGEIDTVVSIIGENDFNGEYGAYYYLNNGTVTIWKDDVVANIFFVDGTPRLGENLVVEEHVYDDGKYYSLKYKPDRFSNELKDMGYGNARADSEEAYLKEFFGKLRYQQVVSYKG